MSKTITKEIKNLWSAINQNYIQNKYLASEFADLKHVNIFGYVPEVLSPF